MSSDGLTRGVIQLPSGTTDTNSNEIASIVTDSDLLRPAATSDDDNVSSPKLVPDRELLLEKTKAQEDAVIQDPEKALERLKTLYAQRQRGCGIQTVGLDDACFALYRVALSIGNDKFRYPQQIATWNRLLRAGLGDLCEEMVTQDDFYLEHLSFIAAVLNMVDATVSYHNLQYPKPTPRASKRVAQVIRTVAALCRGGCSHREVFDMHESRTWGAHDRGTSDTMCHRFRHILTMAATLPGVDNGGVLNFGSLDDGRYFGRMCLYLWRRRVPEDLEEWVGESLLGLSLQTMAGCSKEDYFDFFNHEVVEVIGPFDFLASLRDSLQRADYPDPALQGYYILAFLAPGISMQSFWPHYSSSGFFAALRHMLDSCASIDDAKQWTFLEASLGVLFRITEDAPVNDAASPLIRHFDIVELMSRSSIVYARAESAQADDQVCMEIIRGYTRVAAALGHRSGKNTLRKAFRQAARREWYRTLKTLREISLQDRRAARKCARLVPAWREFGRALDLDEESEKADFDREMKKAAQLCAWKDCEYHERRPPHPTRACAGCAEARYCSRLCQQRDRNEGGHKEKCKRLKEEPHRPRHDTTQND
ncbi:hypothetical protein PENSPDRAFT_487228 [Peniophora sp. CONT]|nr:hypothetical protein PENSPDRAFT_487228 [Peniophora sp. CONT]